MGGVQASDSLGDRGCQLLPVADGRGGALVALGTLGGGVHAPEAFEDRDRVLRVLQDAPIAFNVPGEAYNTLNGLHDDLVAPGPLEYVTFTVWFVLDWPC